MLTLLVDHLSTNGNYDDTNTMMNNNIINYYTKAVIFFETNFTKFMHFSYQCKFEFKKDLPRWRTVGKYSKYVSYYISCSTE